MITSTNALPKIVWTSPDGHCRVIQGREEVELDEYPFKSWIYPIYVEEIVRQAFFGEPVWRRTDHDSLPNEYLRALLVQQGLAIPDAD